MDNTNPLKYSDLIQPDDSIQKLIGELDEAIAKEEKLRGVIQGAANDRVKAMSAVSGATDEQRQEILKNAEATESLLKAYRDVGEAMLKDKMERAKLTAASREETQVSKLLVEINNSAEGSYKRLSAQYRLNKIALNEMSAAERENTEFGKKLEKETKAIYEEMSRLQKATGKYTLEVGNYQNALKGLPGPIGMVVSGFTNMRTNLSTISNSSLPIAQKAMQGFTTVLSGTIGLVMIFVRQLTGSAKTMREFEQANANLATILGKSQADMKMLTESSLELGRTTEYTARQVTQLQTELAKLGFGEAAIINMSESVLHFATAVGANLADAASVAGSTLRAFGLTSEDTERVLSVLAVATNNSALSFSRIKESVGQVFPVAKAFGITIEDTTALLGALANAGFDASSAATATRNILLKMADANGKLAKAMGGPVSTFDEMIDGLNKLHDSGIDLAGALELTDKRSVAAFSALLSGADSAKELRDKLTDVNGELQRISEERLDTVEGQTKLLKSAWEGLTLAFRNSQGAIKDTITGLTDLINAVTELISPDETAIANHAKWVFDELKNEYLQYGKAAAESLRAQYEQIDKEWVETTKSKNKNFFTRIFGGASNQRDAENSLKGYERAIEQFNTFVTNSEEERARAAQEAQEAQEEAQAELTKEEKKRIEAAKKQRIADRRAVIEAIDLEISVTEAGTDKMLELRKDKINAQRQLELEQNRQKSAKERQDEAAINAKYDKQLLDAEKSFNSEVAKLAVQRLQAEQQAIQLQIAITEDGTEEMLQLRLDNIEKQRLIELEQNRQKAKELQQDETAIEKKYEALKLRERTKFSHELAKRDLAALQDYQQAENDLIDQNERQKTLFRLEQEKARLVAILELDKTATDKMTAQEIAAIKKTIEAIEKEASRVPYKNMYELLGIKLDSEQQSALNTAIDSVKDSISGIVDSWNQAAQAAVDSANAQVDAAQKVLDAEIEARNAGYANNVAMAQKDLELAKRNQAKAQKEQEKAQKAQIALDSIEQASSLVTASANIWKALSGITGIGPALAVAAIATMWGSFAAAKVKAVQVTKQEQYGEGTVELLQGGSHASGHDIDLGTKRDGTRRRAEGGEFFAVINKRSSRRFRSVIPDVINSLNDGTFADRYQRANAAMAGMAVGMIGGSTDVSGLERDVAAIRKQGDETQYVDGNGTTVIKYKNLTRKIYKN